MIAGRWIQAAAASAVVVGLGVPTSAWAKEVWARGEASLTIKGEIRELGVYTRQTDATDFSMAIANDIATLNTTCISASSFANCPAFNVVGDEEVGQGLTRLRLEADLDVTKWLSAVVIYDNEIRYGKIDTLESQLDSGIAPDSFLGAEAELSEGAHYDWEHQLYRGFVRIETNKFELEVGRQRVAWGVGRLWNPIDRFSALPPLSIQPDVTPGIDGIDGRFNFDGFNYAQVVYAPGSSPKNESWALRLHGMALDADLSLMGGAFEEAPTLGFDFARNLGDAAIGLETVWTSPKHKVWKVAAPGPRKIPDYWQIVASIDMNLDLGTGLYVLGEYLYNGNALGFGSGRAGTLLPFFESTNTPPPGVSSPAPYVKSADEDIFGASRVVSNAEHQVGVQLGYDLTPELRGDLVTLIDLDEGSVAFYPNLGYSPLDSVQLTFGVQLFAGPRRSQYGSLEPLVSLLADWYF